MPHEDFLYAGDTAHFPYGAARPTSCAGSREIAAGSCAKAVKLIVSPAIRHRNRPGRPAAGAEVPVIGVLTPEARAAVQLTRNRRIGCSRPSDSGATAATASSYTASTPGIELVEVACPGWPMRSSGGELTTSDGERVRVHCAPLREVRRRT